jgi:polyhydroxyalkanoate synthesis regulator protein
LSHDFTEAHANKTATSESAPLADGATSGDSKMNGKRHIRLYRNRRLYDCDAHYYVTHDDLLSLLERGVDFWVDEHWSGADCTDRILVELLVMAEQRWSARECQGPTAEFLRQMIRLRGTCEPALVRAFLDHTMRNMVNEERADDSRSRPESLSQPSV